MDDLHTFELTNNQGDRITVANFGARLISWNTTLGEETRQVILAYQELTDYLKDPYFMGAIVGPYANRISRSHCQINHTNLYLKANEGEHHLHGGNGALANQFWQCEEYSNESVCLSCTLPDGFNGYPGKINTRVTYSLSNESQLTIKIMVNSSKPTIAGPTAHPYFNLNACQLNNDHHLQINAEHYTPVDHQGIPDGKIVLVKNTPFDFQKLKKLSSKIQLDDNFLTSETDITSKEKTIKQAVLTSDDKQLSLHVSSNYPALQVYTGQHLNKPFIVKQAICLEPQFCPDSPNQANFPFHITSPEMPLSTKIIYKLNKQTN